MTRSHVLLRRTVLQSVVAASLVLGTALPVHAGAVDDAGSLAKIAVSNHPGSTPWAVNMTRSNNSDYKFRVVGAGNGANARVRLTSPANVVSWMIGSKEFGAIISKREYEGVLDKASLGKARFAEIDGEEPRYLLVRDTYRVDSSVRPDAVAAWLATSGPVERTVVKTGSKKDESTVLYNGVRDADVTLPAGVGAVFFPDKEHVVEVTIRVQQNVIVGYQFLNRAERESRVLDVTRVAAPRVLPAPKSSELTKFSTLSQVITAHDLPTNLLPSVLAKVRPGADLTRFRAALLEAAVMNDVDVAFTRTGVVVYPGYPLRQRFQLSEARCLDRATNWTVRACTADDNAVLGEKLEPYGASVAAFAENEEITGREASEFFSNLGHQMALYSNLELTADETAAWGWFVLDTYVRIHGE